MKAAQLPGIPGQNTSTFSTILHQASVLVVKVLVVKVLVVEVPTIPKPW
jgi:hypothetical protein